MLGGRLLETENKRIYQISCLKSGHSRLRNLSSGCLRESFINSIWLRNKTVIQSGRYERVDCISSKIRTLSLWWSRFILMTCIPPISYLLAGLSIRFVAVVCTCDSRRQWQSKWLYKFFQVFIDHRGQVAGVLTTDTRQSSGGSGDALEIRFQTVDVLTYILVSVYTACNLKICS